LKLQGRAVEEEDKKFVADTYESAKKIESAQA
jgi:hypothetical protein